jgi:hypothetical protein
MNVEGQMFAKDHYVPVLKWKRGEKFAIKDLTNAVKSKMTPLIEVPPIAWDFINDMPAKSVDQHLEKVVDSVGDSWGQDRPAFLDLQFIDSDERMNDSSHPLEYIFNSARAINLPMIPVTGLDRDSAYQSSVSRIYDIDGLGVCLRLDLDEVADDSDPRIASLVSALRVPETDIDLALDLEYIEPTRSSLLARSILNFIRLSLGIQRWRNIILLGTSFPKELKFDPNTDNRVPRAEWEIWNYLLRNQSKIHRIPTFGDYTIVHPEPFETLGLDPRIMQFGAKVKYTCVDSWMIIKGESFKKATPAEQNQALCRYLVGQPEYRGPSFSWGDKTIDDCANRKMVGSLETWVRAGVNHHITFVINQLASAAVS